MKNKKSVMIRGLAALLTGTLAVTLFAGMNTASAATSLPHIADIVSNLQNNTSSTFQILEIVPQADAGSIGYYISGQEPTAVWQQALAAITTPAGRETYMETLRGQLVAKGLLSSTVETPLVAANAGTAGSLYDEVYPWARISGTAYRTLSINTEEVETAVQGVMTQKDGDTTEGFDYTQHSDNHIVNLQEDGEDILEDYNDGVYVQNISRFEYMAAAPTSGTYYFYQPTFAELDVLDETKWPEPLSAVYTKNADEPYAYYGRISDGLTIEADSQYYYVDLTAAVNTGKPSETWSAETPYAAEVNVLQPFTAVDTTGKGWFNVTPTYYEYQGDGQGNFKFTGGGGETVEIHTQAVCYAGGYANNNWFTSKVLDVDGADKQSAISRKIKVTSATPGSVTTEMVGSANLIVISAGFSLSGAPLAQYGSGNDLLSTVSNTIRTAVTDQHRAIILDRAAAGGGNIGGLVNTLLNVAKKPGSYVSQNLFVLDGLDASITTTHFPLATKDFAKAFEPVTSYTAVSGAFYEVYAEITHENFLRKTENPATTDLLAETVSMAQCVRYILNFAGQRVVTQKHTVRVLDIEPDTDSELGTGNAAKDKVISWFPSGVLGEDTSGNGAIDQTEQRAAVTITTMSTSEFVGKMEDVSENYDLVYIGSEVGDFSKFYQLNDAGKTDLVYTNIGDTVTKGYNMAGLLDSDYYTGTTVTHAITRNGITYNENFYPLKEANATTTFRYSGNDLTAKKMKALQDFAAAGYPVIVSDDLLADNGWPADTFILAAGVDCADGDAVSSLTAMPSLQSTVTGKAVANDTLTYTYQWYRTTSGTAVASTMTLSNPMAGNTYYCVVSTTYHGQTFTARTENVGITSATTSMLSVSAFNNSNNVTVTGQPSGYVSSVTLVATVTGSNSSSYSGDWYYYNQGYFGYERGDRLAAGNTLTISAAAWPASGNSLTCRFRATRPYSSSSRQSQLYTITKSNVTVLTADLDAALKTSQTHSVTEYVNKSTDTSHVDGASQMYQLIDSIKNKSNVQRASAAAENAVTTYEYLNLSKPEIKLIEQPPEYSETDKTNAKYQITSLRYTFQIINATDPTPLSTTYNLELILDTDANGYFDTGEVLGDIHCTDSAGNEVDPQFLSGGVTAELAPRYTVTRDLPADMAGYVSWKLEAIKNGVGNQYIHASQIGNTYVKLAANEAKTITVLQVDSTADGYRGDNGGYNLEKSTVYSGLLNASTVKSDFIVKIYTIYTEDLDALFEYADDGNWADAWSGYFQKRTGTSTNSYNRISRNGTYTDVYQYLYGANGAFRAAEAGSSPEERLTYFLKQFDMLILGFGDCYNELDSKTTALAVQNYINTGLPTLVAHDTTSFYNVPYNQYPIRRTTSGGGGGSSYSYVPSDNYFWGYGFNTILRNLVSMDRYGVSDKTYGRSKFSYAYNGMTTSGIVASGVYGSLNSTQKENLTKASYSIAYQPITSAPTASNLVTVPQTHGYSNYQLETQHLTSTVTQVNKGQITSYPYNINTKAFDQKKTNTTISVAETHQQYYQINMNKGDIAVWYCLSSENYQKNDAANGYYIYTVDNVTYTGAGHSSRTGNVSANDEAKLFVNTMIAAYRTARTAPEIKFYASASGSGQMTSYVLTSDYAESGRGYAAGVTEKSADCPVYFEITDNNLDGTRVNQISLSYTDAATSATVTVPYTALTIRRVGTTTGESLNGKALASGRRYYFNLPQSLLDSFGNAVSLSSMEVSFKASAVFTNKDESTTEESSEAKLSLFKMGLLNLA